MVTVLLQPLERTWTIPPLAFDIEHAISEEHSADQVGAASALPIRLLPLTPPSAIADAKITEAKGLGVE